MERKKASGRAERLLQQVMSRPECELFGGPFDGAKHRIPPSLLLLDFYDCDRPIVDVYAREGDTNRFTYRGRYKTKGPDGWQKERHERGQ